MFIHSLRRIAKPTVSPITVPEAKLFLKIDNDLEDNLLQNMINAAVEIFEDYTSTALMSQTWEIVYKKIDSSIIELPIKPISKILQISELDIYLQDKNISSYKFLGDTVFLDYLSTAYMLRISLEAGFPTVESMPEDLKLALLEHVAFSYDHRNMSVRANLQRYDRFRMIKR